MKQRYEKYRNKVKKLIDRSNIEAEVNVNWKVVVVVSVTVGSLFLFTIMFVNNLIDYKRVLKEKSQIEHEIKVVENDIETLKAQQDQSQNVEFIEKQAREKLKMVKSNETIYIDIAE